MAKTHDDHEGESAEAAYKRGHADGHAIGYASGIEHATQEFQSRLQNSTAAAATVPVGTPNEELAKFVDWQFSKGELWVWEDECMAQLADAMRPGDRIEGLYAFSCRIVHADGTTTAFNRRPNPKPVQVPPTEVRR